MAKLLSSLPSSSSSNSENSKELVCVGTLEIATPKPVGFLCGSIPVPTDKSFHHAFHSALLPTPQTYSLSLSSYCCFCFNLNSVLFFENWAFFVVDYSGGMLRVTVTGCCRPRLILIRHRFWQIFRTRFFLLALCTPRQLEEVLILYPWRNSLIIYYKWKFLFNASRCSILLFVFWVLVFYAFLFFIAVIHCNLICLLSLEFVLWNTRLLVDFCFYQYKLLEFSLNFSASGSL